MAREAALAWILLAPLLLGLASAKQPPAPTVTYLDAAGNLSLGLPGASLAPAPPSFEAPWHDRFTLEVDSCHRRLVLDLGFQPRNVSLESPVARLSTPFELVLVLRDNETGMQVQDGRMRWLVPGAHGLTLDGPAELTADLYLERGRDVSYDLRATGWVPPEAMCAFQGELFLNEVEADPPGRNTDRTQWVELYNGGLTTVDLDGWTLATEDAPKERFPLPEGATLSPGDHRVVTFEGPFLDDEEGVVVLLAPDGWEVDRTPPLSDTAHDPRTWQRTPDGAETWQFSPGTPGDAN